MKRRSSPSATGPLWLFGCVRFLSDIERGAAGGVWPQPRRWRSALRADCTALLGPGSRRPTRFAHFVRCARTNGAESDHEARCARRPRSCAARRHPLGCGQTPPAALQPPSFAQEPAATGRRCARAGGCGVRGKAPALFARVARARSALRDLTCRRLSERSDCRERSELGGRATRANSAGKSPLAATALRRAPQPPARARLRLAPTSARSGRRSSATGRQQTARIGVSFQKA